MKDRTGHLNPEFTNLTEVEVRLDAITIREDLKTGSGQIMCTEGDQDMDKIIEAGQDIIQIIEVVGDITQQVIKDMGSLIIIIIEGEDIEVKITIGIRVGHMRDRTEIEETAEV